MYVCSVGWIVEGNLVRSHTCANNPACFNEELLPSECDILCLLVWISLKLKNRTPRVVAEVIESC